MLAVDDTADISVPLVGSSNSWADRQRDCSAIRDRVATKMRHRIVLQNGTTPIICQGKGHRLRLAAAEWMAAGPYRKETL